MAYYSRSSWTSAGKGGTVLKGTGRTMTTIYIHYPGSGGTIGKASVASTKSRLEGYRRQHKNGNGWADIAYNVAVDQSGNVWELRGIDRQSGANGGTASNRSGQAILVLVGNNEAPTAECVAGIKDAVRRIRAVHPKAKTIRGHQQSPDASTACPGAHLMKLVRSGGLEPGASVPSVPAGGASAPKPSKPATKGKVGVDGRLGRETSREIQRQLNASKRTKRKLTVDGRLGTDTYKSLQEHLGGNVIDGVIENQSYKPTELGNGVGPHGWQYTGRGSKGSATVRRLQRHLGVKDVDGILYEGTTKALQKALNAGKF